MATILRTIESGTHLLITVADFAENGTTIDTTEQLAIGGQTAAVQTTVGTVAGSPPVFTPDPVGRVVKLAAIQPGTALVTVSAPNVPTPNRLTIDTTCTPPANNSRIDFVSETGPHPN